MSLAFHAVDEHGQPLIAAQAFITVVYDEGVEPVLAALGLLPAGLAGPVVDGFGIDEPGSFLGRVLVAQALAPYDLGAPALTLSDGGVVPARGKGYVQTVLMPLGDLARWADRASRRVAWS